MKRILSLLLSTALVISAIPMAYATNTNTSETPDNPIGTQVTYTNEQASEWYSVSIPSKMRPGDTGTVSLEGEWANNRVVHVTADATVTLVNQLNKIDSAELAITFPGIHKEGDNTIKKVYSEYISVANMPANALFGTWQGIFNYNVEITDKTP